MRPQRRNPWPLASILTLLLLSGVTFAANDLQGSDMVRIGNDVTVEEGRVVKDAVAIGGSVAVLSGGRVMGNAVAIGGDVNLKANARVEGDTVAIGGEILKEEGASVGRNEVAILSGAKGILPAFWKWSPLDFLYRSYLASLILHILVVMVIAALGVFLLLFLPDSLQIISSTIRQSALKSGGWGKHPRDRAPARLHHGESPGDPAGPCARHRRCGGGDTRVCRHRVIRGGKDFLPQRRVHDTTISRRDAHPRGPRPGSSRGWVRLPGGESLWVWRGSGLPIWQGAAGSRWVAVGCWNLLFHSAGLRDP
jgi:hypothetical protein